MSKRGRGEGTVYKRADGRWAAAVTLPNGRRKYFYAATRQEVARKLTAALKARQDGLPLASGRETVGAFLRTWLEAIRPSVRPRTWQRYEEYVRIHVAPALGKLPLARLQPHHLQRLYADRLKVGASPTDVRHLHSVIHHALKDGVRWGLIAHNVADLVTPPRIQRREMQTLSPEEARRFLEAAAGDRLEALYTLAITTGMRQGELLALRWQDVDLEAGTVQVRGTLQRTAAGLVVQEPKTRTSRRLVALTGAAVAALRRHKARQLEERLRAGAVWQDTGFVFTNEIGGPLEVRNLIRRSFWPLLERAGLPRIRFHDLRHTAATLMLAQGVHPKVAAEMLGHSQVAVTLDLYSHVTPTMQRQAAAAMDALLCN